MTMYKKAFIFLYLAAIFIFITHLLITKTAVYGDGRYYYSYLPSIILDQSLNFNKAFAHLGISDTFNIYPIGPAIFWSIPFTLINIISIPFNQASGYGAFYDIGIGIWDITLVFIGILLLRKALLRFFDEKVSDITVLTIFTSTNLLFYGA